MITPADVFETLPRLSADDLRRVQERCAALLKLSGKPALLRKRSAFDLAQAIYDAINAEALKRLPSWSPAPYAVFCRQAIGKRYAEAMPAVEATHKSFMRGASGRDGSDAAQQSMCTLYARVIVAWASARSLPLVWPIYIVGLRELSARVDEAFPGYASNGVLSLVRSIQLHPKVTDAS